MKSPQNNPSPLISGPEQAPPESRSARFLAIKGKRWLLADILQVHLLLLFIVVIYIALQNYSTVYAAVVEAVGVNVDVVFIIILVWVVWLAYAIALLARTIWQVRKAGEARPRRLNKIIPAFTTFLFTVLYVAVLFVRNDLFGIFYRIMSFPGLLLLGEATFALIVLAPVIALSFKQLLARTARANAPQLARVKSILGTTLAFAIFVGIVAVPYFAVPTNILPGELPPKPQCIAHRGGGFLGPENTIEGATAMQQFGAVGWEIDIRLSRDGVPFLLHDTTLFRTTNVAEVFPGREFEPASDFTIAELRQLDAGSRFLTEPNALVARQYLNESTLTSYRGAKIATLAEAIAKSEEWGWAIDANLKGLPEGHPYEGKYDTIVLTMLNTSHVPKVFIAGYLDQTSPHFFHVAKDSQGNPATLVAKGYDVIGIDDLRSSDAKIREIVACGVPTYIQILNEPITFSQAWCLGMTYVLTDTPHMFQGMVTPLWAMPLVAWYGLLLATHVALFANLAIAWIRLRRK